MKVVGLEDVVLGQYRSRTTGGKQLPGYLDDPTVPPGRWVGFGWAGCLFIYLPLPLLSLPHFSLCLCSLHPTLIPLSPPSLHSLPLPPSSYPPRPPLHHPDPLSLPPLTPSIPPSPPPMQSVPHLCCGCHVHPEQPMGWGALPAQGRQGTPQEICRDPGAVQVSGLAV